MKILHITPHLGGGIGTVILNWTNADKKNDHKIVCFEEQKTPRDYGDTQIAVSFDKELIFNTMKVADICLLHMWDHPLNKKFLEDYFNHYVHFPEKKPVLIAWCHQNYELSEDEMLIPDVLVLTSPVIPAPGESPVIWSTGGIDKYLKVKPKKHEGFNIGYIGTIDYKKMHPEFFKMCWEIIEKIPNVKVHLVGHNSFPHLNLQLGFDKHFIVHGWLDDIRPILEILDVFFYPLRPDHYGTCEQVLGEAMAAGVVPVVLDNPAEIMIVDDFINGRVCRTPESAVKAVEWFYEPEKRWILAENARKKATQLYSMDKMIKAWNELFKEVKDESCN